MTGYAADAEPLLPDSRVLRIRERLMLKYPDLPDSTQLLTAQKGDQFQFVVFCDYPRPQIARMGTKLAKTARGLLAGWREAEQEQRHFVTGRDDPAFVIFNGLAWSLVNQLRSIRSIVN